MEHDEKTTDLSVQAPSFAEFKLLGSAPDGSQDGTTEPGTFSGYLAHYGNLDENGDIIHPGAFAASIADYKARGMSPPMLLNHGGIPRQRDTHMSTLPIGVWTSLSEDQNGLRVTGRIDPMDTDLAKMVYAGLRNRTLKGLSVGYYAQEFKRGDGKSAPRRLITKASLFEGSIVGDPANRRATIDTVKAVVEDEPDELEAKLEVIAEAYKQRFKATFAGKEFDPQNVLNQESYLHHVMGYSWREAKGMCAFWSNSGLSPTHNASVRKVLPASLVDLKSALSDARSVK